MPDRNAPSQNSSGDNLSAGVDRLTERAGQLNERVSDIARAAAEKVDENREAAGRRLETVSTSLHERADNLPGGRRSVASPTPRPTPSVARRIMCGSTTWTA